MKGLFALIEALQAGRQLADPGVWARRANLISILTVLLTSLLGAAQAFGIDIRMTGVDIASVAQGIAVVGTTVAAFIHTASNKDAGIKPKR